jgi:hypothetical protein
VAKSFRFAPFPRRCSGTFCQPRSLLRKALIRAGKTSPTAVLNYEIYLNGNQIGLLKNGGNSRLNAF